MGAGTSNGAEPEPEPDEVEGEGGAEKAAQQEADGSEAAAGNKRVRCSRLLKLQVKVIRSQIRSLLASSGLNSSML